MSHKSYLLPLVKKYFEKDPVAAAHNLEMMGVEEAVEVLKSIPASASKDVVHHLEASFAANLLQKTSPHLFREIVEHLDSQHGASIFMHLSEDSRKAFLEPLGDKKKRQIQEFLSYPENSAGRIMTIDFIAFHGDIKVKEAIQKIRQLAQKNLQASYTYVLDHENRLIGVMNMRDMMLASGDTTLESVMRREVMAVDCFMDREEVANLLSERKFFAVPVINHENKLLGVIHAERLIDDVQEEATEDLQKMFGAGGDERVFSPIPFSLRMRIPWLYVNLATAFLAATVVALFENVIAKITVLAIYLPVIAGQGGNAGAQSLAVVMRGLVMREVSPHKAGQLVLKEMWIGVINGLAIGAVTALVAWLWHGNPYLGLVVGLGMFANLVIAGLFGASIPLTMKSIGLDPAQCSNIILTTVTDVMGFFVFLGLAVLFQNLLI